MVWFIFPPFFPPTLPPSLTLTHTYLFSLSPSLSPSLPHFPLDIEEEPSSPIPDDLDPLLSPSSQLPQHPPANRAHTVSGASTRPRKRLPSEDNVFVPTCPPISERDENSPTPDILSSLSVSLALPDHSHGRGIQAPYRRPDDQVLVFHGIILRSQLVTLLENGIFFEETKGVRDHGEFS